MSRGDSSVFELPCAALAVSFVPFQTISFGDDSAILLSLI
jgi:hypothetical protein